MEYHDAYDNLSDAFKIFAKAKQEFLNAGGELSFEVRHGQLIMSTGSSKMSFPFVIDKNS